ncbi:hypothetical protein [Salmonella phage SSBI34]|nr:hypothetical protein [Salmonella phage SSBI34]
MNNENFKLSLSFVTPDINSLEHVEYFPTFEDAIEEANEIAFTTVGYPLEDWKVLDFGFESVLYSFCPNEADCSSRYKLTIVKEEL